MSMHYVGLFATYIIESKPCITLLSVSPMAKINSGSDDSSDSDGNEDETTSFTAEAHVSHFKNVFEIFGIQDYKSWLTNQTADNAKVNVKVSNLLGIPHVACKSHCLNLEVNHMCDDVNDLKNCIESVHETMVQCKGKLTNAALLRNISRLKPIIHNKTRWSGKYYMLNRFTKIWSSLLEVAQNDQVSLDIDESAAFARKVDRYQKQLYHINLTTKFLQTRLLPLSMCVSSLDMLHEDIEEHKQNDQHNLYRCKLKKKYTVNHSSIVVDHYFESGVKKIQENNIHLMTENEHLACSKLRLETINNSSQDENEELSYMERIMKRQKKSDSEYNYGNCHFILGSVAEVERLWSICDNVLNDHRNRMSPLLFECIVFLKINKRFWGVAQVAEAMKMHRDEVQTRVEEEALLHIDENQVCVRRNIYI